MIMKKILMFMAIMIAVVSLSSCNSLEDKAKKRLRTKIEEVVKNPETFKITSEKVIYSNDSVCTISFIGRGQNDFGEYYTSRMEYTIVKLQHCDDGKIRYWDSLLNMGSKDRITSIERAIDYIDADFLYDEHFLGDTFLKMDYDRNIKKGMSKEDAKADCLYVRAALNSLGNEIDL